MLNYWHNRQKLYLNVGQGDTGTKCAAYCLVNKWTTFIYSPRHINTAVKWISCSARNRFLRNGVTQVTGEHVYMRCNNRVTVIHAAGQYLWLLECVSELRKRRRTESVKCSGAEADLFRLLETSVLVGIIGLHFKYKGMSTCPITFPVCSLLSWTCTLVRNLVTCIHGQRISVLQEKCTRGNQVWLIPYPDYSNQVCSLEISLLEKADCDPVTYFPFSTMTP